MGMGPDDNVADQIAGKLEGMLEVVRKVGHAALSRHTHSPAVALQAVMVVTAWCPCIKCSIHSPVWDVAGLG
jgi:hypothetical protein